MKRKIIVFPKHGGGGCKRAKQDAASLVQWLESLDSLRSDRPNDDLEIFLNLVWMRQYLMLASQGQVSADEDALDKLSGFLDLSASYLSGRLGISSLLKHVEHHTVNGYGQGELYSRLCAFLEPYMPMVKP